METVSQQLLTDQAYSIIKNAIIHREFKPGEHLVENVLANKIGTSRTIIQKVLIRLQEEKLVVKKSNNRAFVNELNKEELLEIWEIRKVLEVLSTQKAAMNHTKEDIKRLNSFFNVFSLEKALTGTFDSKELKEYEKRDRNFHEYIAKMSKNTTLCEILNNFSVQERSFAPGYFRYPNETFPEHLEIIKGIAEKDIERVGKLVNEHCSKTIKKIEELHF